MDAQLSPLAKAVIAVFTAPKKNDSEQKIAVNRFVSEIASWYEKVRNAMDYRDDEVVLRAAIERILKRRLLLGGSGKTTAEPLVKELIWARYFPSESIAESIIQKVEDIIDVHLQLRELLLAEQHIKEATIQEWFVHLLSCALARLLSPNIEKNAMSNFMYHVMKDSLVIKDDTEDTKNVQVYLAVRRAFAKDDLAFLRYYLFGQIFGELTKETVHHIASNFSRGMEEIEYQLGYRLKEKIFLFVRRQTPVFYILEDILLKEKEKFIELVTNPEEFEKAVFAACEKRYKSIRKRVTTAIIRSVIFLIMTKVIVAYLVEGTYDRIIYGHIVWQTLALNTGIPPLLMIFVSLFIKTPGKDNSTRIFEKIKTILFEEQPRITQTLPLTITPPKNKGLLNTIFGFLWFLAFFVSFGLIIWLLTQLHFNIVSQGIFVFFIAVVSFLSYRINATAHMYSIDGKQMLLTPFIDFLIIPVVRVGMYLTEGISQVNVIIFVFDFLIEAPFKAIFNFFDQLFGYLHSKREELG